MRKLGIDYGDARIGIAVTDETCLISSPLEVYKRKRNDSDFEYLASLIKEYNIDVVVIGMPLNMDGSEGERAEITRAFAKRLNEFADVGIEFVDERMTSMQAMQILIDANVKKDKRNALVDKLSAQIILQSYLDNNKNKK